ncbi:MAG: DUF4198 domain-containing protein [Planctomycetia bacterium]
MNRFPFLPALMFAAAIVAAGASAHDTWVQTATAVVRPDDVVHVDLALGNHGNDHRDFKLAGKLSSLEQATLAVHTPRGRTIDLVPDLVDLGYAPKEGYWSARTIAAEEGLHCIAHTLDRVHGTKRTRKSAKAYFLVTRSLDTPPLSAAGNFATPLGHPLELVLETHPVLRAGPGREIKVRLLFRGQPLADERVSFIPRGAQLAEGFDPHFERRTDAEGRCSYTPREGNYLLVVARRTDADDRGPGHDRTVFSATLVLAVPQRCGCCDGAEE